MAEELLCFRCGASLSALTPPISRQDECPECSVYLHVCRMCSFFDSSVPEQCREDDAEEVLEKERLNFCEWFKPSAAAFDADKAAEAIRSKSDLAALFGEEEQQRPDSDALGSAADDLFK